MPSSEEHVMRSQLKSCICTSSILASSLPRLKLSLILLLVLLVVQFPQQRVMGEEELPTCSRYQACAVEMMHYPLLAESVGSMVELGSTAGAEEGSGEEEEGSGVGLELREEPTAPTTFPFYDEQVEAQTSVFDYHADGEMSTKQICRCPNEDDDSSVECGFSSQEHIMEVDKSVRLSFLYRELQCKPVNRLFPKCKGQRGLMRIIGEVDTKSGDTIYSVNDTVVFCRCASAMRRASIEPWMGKFSFNYRCEWSPVAGSTNPDAENKSS